MKVIYTKDVYASYRVTLENAEKVEQALQKMVEEGQLSDAEFMDDELCVLQQKCFSVSSPEFRVDCSIIRQWGNKPNPKRDTCVISVNASKYPDQLVGFVKDTDLNLAEYGQKTR